MDIEHDTETNEFFLTVVGPVPGNSDRYKFMKTEPNPFLKAIHPNTEVRNGNLELVEVIRGGKTYTVVDSAFLKAVDKLRK
jgi:hypothetical protein